MYGLSSWFPEACDKQLKDKIFKFHHQICKITNEEVHAVVEIPSNVYEQKAVLALLFTARI